VFKNLEAIADNNGLRIALLQ